MVLPPNIPGGGGPPLGGPPAPPDPGLAILRLLPPDLMQFDWGQPVQVGVPQGPQPPSIQDIQDKYQRQLTRWSPRDTRMQDDQDLYDMTGADNAGPTTYVSNLPPTTVDKIAGMVGGHTPVVRVVPPQNYFEKPAQKVEDTLRYAWYSWDRRWSDMGHNGLRRELAWYAAQRGWVAGRIQLNPNFSGDGFPIKVTPVDPIKVYPSWGDDGLEYVIWHDYMLVSDIITAWPDSAQQLQSRQETEQIEVIAYYDRDFFAVLVEGQPAVPPTQHGYGFVPWEIQLAGGSPIRSDTRPGASNAFTANIGPSIYHSTRNAYQMRDSVLSQLSQIVANASDPPVAVKYDKVTGEPQEFSLSPGATNYFIYGKEDVEILNQAINPAVVAPLLSALNDDLFMGSIPKVLWGGADPSMSGLAIALLSGAARDALLPIITCVQRFEEGIYRKCLIILRDIFQQPVGIVTKDAQGNWVGGATITPEEIGQVGLHISVEYKDLSPKDQFRQMQMAIALTDKSLISMETARHEYLGIDNPDRENSRIVDELIYKDPEVMKGILVPWSLYRNDPTMWEVWQALQQYHQQQQQGLPAPGAPPPGNPNSAHPGTPAGPGTPPTLLPPQLTPTNATFNPIQQALGAAAGGADLQRQPGVGGIGGIIPGGNGVAP